MSKLNNTGITLVIGIVMIVLISSIGAVAAGIGNAYWFGNRSLTSRSNTSGGFSSIFDRSLSNTISNTGSRSRAVCNSSGNNVTEGNASCTSTSISGSTSTGTCIVNGEEVHAVNGNCKNTTTGSSGSQGVTTCSANGHVVQTTSGSCTAVSDDGNASCTINGVAVAC